MLTLGKNQLLATAGRVLARVSKAATQGGDEKPQQDDGKPGKEFKGMVDSVAPINELYGNLIANDFGPLKLKTIRQHMIDRDLCRTEVNKRVDRIKRVFKWAVSEELIVPAV